MPVPDFQSLMLPALQAAAEKEITNVECREWVAHSLGLTEDDLSEKLPSGRQTTFYNRVAWALTYLQIAGLLMKAGRGIYQITEEGKRVLAEAPQRIDMRFLERYPPYAKWRSGASTSGEAVGQIGEVGTSAMKSALRKSRWKQAMRH